MATSTFSKQFAVNQEKATEFVNAMSQAVTPTLHQSFHTNIGRAQFVDTDLDYSERPRILSLYTCWGTDYQYKLLVHGLQTRIKELHPINLYQPKEKKQLLTLFDT